MKKRFLYHHLLVLLMAFAGSLNAQVKPAPPGKGVDTTKVDRVIVDFSDYAEGIIEKGREIRKLVGNVELRQDSTYMYCDTAYLIGNNVRAIGNVIIQQGDSTSIFADSLIYQGNKRVADFFGQVVLVNGQQQLFTQRLNYDLNTKIAQYFTGADLVNKARRLSSKRGYYYVESKDAFFKDSVLVIDSSFVLRADTLKYNTQNQIVTFLGPTLITQDTSKIYCESGFYDTANKKAEFTTNAQYSKGEQRATGKIIRYDGIEKMVTLSGNALFTEGEKIATADTILYDETQQITTLQGNAHFIDADQDIVANVIKYNSKTEAFVTSGRSRISDPPQILEADQVDFDNVREMGFATGNVIWQDTVENITIYCERADYDKKRDYLMATGGRPLLTTLLQEDTLFLSSDTLVSIRADSMVTDSNQNNRILMAFRDVRIFKSDLQAVSDSLSYHTRDSIFQFFDDPIIWSDTSQFSADTIDVRLVNGAIDTIFMKNNGFIVNSPDEKFFNQIKGKNITAFFRNNELYEVLVEGNAESVYYALDDEKAYLGVNKTVCSEMLLYFGNNEVERIKFLSQPKANLFPMKQANHKELELKGFRWVINRRPRQLDDLF